MVLGLFTEVELKLVAGIRPQGLIVAVAAYPILVSAAYLGSRLMDRLWRTGWLADLVHYLTVGVVGLAIEWQLLGNGPQSNANQLGMFAMWTTFGFGPRVLTRPSTVARGLHRPFWKAFAAVAVLLTTVAFLIPASDARLVVVVVALVATYVVWSAWLLLMAWRTRHRP